MSELVSQLNWLDYLLLLLIAVSLVASLVRGFTREIAGLVALVLAILLGMWFHGAIGAYFLPYVSSPEIANLLGFGVIFLGITTLGAITGHLIAKVLKVAGLSLFDRLLGGVFGLLKGVLTGAIVVFGMLAFSPAGPPVTVSQSVVAPYVMWTADLLAAIAPRGLRDAVEKNITDIRGRWRKSPGLLPSLPSDEAPASAPSIRRPQVAPAPGRHLKPSPHQAGHGASEVPPAGWWC